MDKLLTVKNLAERWQKDEGTIRRYIKEGTITPCKGVPGTMFSPSYIAKLEGVELERFSPLQKKKMEKEIEELNNQLNKYKAIIKRVACIGAESLSLLSK